MHYRWFYEEGARFASGDLAREVMGGLHLPLFVKRAMLRRRQRNGYTRGDGIGPEAVAGVEADVAALFSQLEDIFSKRPYLLGDRPTLADIGFSEPFFRHFALDPIPLQLLRHTAPNTLEWVMRLWNSRPEILQGTLIQGVPDDIHALLQHMARGYLPYLNANVDAVRQGKSTFTAKVDGVTYTQARSSHYRVWCLSELRSRFNLVPQDAQPDLQSLLTEAGIWEGLWAQDNLSLAEGQESCLPFWADHKMLQVNT